MSAIAERVARGAAFLDQHDPEWWRPDVDRAINLAILDLGEPDYCILGQRCPLPVLAEYCNLSTEDADDLSYESWRGYTAYAVTLAATEDFGDLARWGDDHGFSQSAGWDTYPGLTAEWKRVIEQRRAAS